MVAEAYQEAGEEPIRILHPQIDFGFSQAGNAFALLPNRPNPFKEETLLSFFLPQATTARLTVYDPTGKVLYQKEQDYDAGFHQQSLYQSDLDAEGVLFVRLETPTDLATRKMILLK